jgi:ergothioneine biosynthesis protein EgtB
VERETSGAPPRFFIWIRVLATKGPAALEVVLEEALAQKVRSVRQATEDLCRPLQADDFMSQPEECVSPPKWHLAHTAWFFENFLLSRYLPGYRIYDDTYAFLFNSYYESVGPRADKARRGDYSRPATEEIFRFRSAVGEGLENLLAQPHADAPEIRFLIELGIQHEQQHQELLLTDIKRIFHFNPSHPAYLKDGLERPPVSQASVTWTEMGEGLYEIGWRDPGFAFDNEKPSHRYFSSGFRIQDQMVTNARYLGFMEERGYARPELWLAEGWDAIRREGWGAPMYWKKRDGEWLEFTLRGWHPLNPAAPVCHVSYYEADAFARWSGARLPKEEEWEMTANNDDPEPFAGVMLEDGRFHPEPAAGGKGLRQMLGDAWEWTGSAYLPYPGYRPFPGGVGEYNGKFMINQMVLRGGSCVTPRTHLRLTYRNFFPAATRWQFSGIRLVEDLQ